MSSGPGFGEHYLRYQLHCHSLCQAGQGLGNDSLRSQLHGHSLEGVILAVPQYPLYAVGVRCVSSPEVGAVQVTMETGHVPPAALVDLSAVVSALVIVAVLRAEWPVGVVAHRITCAIKYAMNSRPSHNITLICYNKYTISKHNFLHVNILIEYMSSLRDMYTTVRLTSGGIRYIGTSQEV